VGWNILEGAAVMTAASTWWWRMHLNSATVACTQADQKRVPRHRGTSSTRVQSMANHSGSSYTSSFETHNQSAACASQPSPTPQHSTFKESAPALLCSVCVAVHQAYNAFRPQPAKWCMHCMCAHSIKMLQVRFQAACASLLRLCLKAQPRVISRYLK
jgi:hypothetical protein